MKYPFAVMIVLGLLASGAAHASNSRVENALASQSDLSTFYQALQNTGVANELNQNTEYTIFAPTNAAFAEIQSRVYPCFYTTQCRTEIAAVLRNHIVPRNESIGRFAKWGGEVPTIGNRRLDVEEPYKDQYTVEGRSVLYSDESNGHFQGEGISLYKIDSVIASDQELALFRAQPFADRSGAVTRKTVTTYHTSVVSPAMSDGYHAAPTAYAAPKSLNPDDDIETTTVTHTTITQ